MYLSEYHPIILQISSAPKLLCYFLHSLHNINHDTWYYSSLSSNWVSSFFMRWTQLSTAVRTSGSSFTKRLPPNKFGRLIWWSDWLIDFSYIHEWCGQMELEQLECPRSEETPRRPMITHTIDQLILNPKSILLTSWYQIPSQNKVKAEKWEKFAKKLKF